MTLNGSRITENKKPCNISLTKIVTIIQHNIRKHTSNYVKTNLNVFSNQVLRGDLNVQSRLHIKRRIVIATTKRREINYVFITINELTT